jgi:hypothetical protein
MENNVRENERQEGINQLTKIQAATSIVRAKRKHITNKWDEMI